jgi:hypothetical protein
MGVRKLGDWTLIAALTAGGGFVAGRAGLPSGYLYASMLDGCRSQAAASGSARR